MQWDCVLVGSCSVPRTLAGAQIVEMNDMGFLTKNELISTTSSRAYARVRRSSNLGDQDFYLIP